MTRVHTIILASYIALLLTAPGTVVVQETATASVSTETMTIAVPTTASESSDETTYYGDVAGDCAVRIVSVEYVDGAVVLVLESDLLQMVTVTTPTGSTSTGAVVGNLARRLTPSGQTTTRIDSPEPRMTLIASYSVEND